MNTNDHPGDKAQRTALWISAGVLLALLGAQTLLGAPPVGGGGSAHAGMVSQRGQHTVMTTESGNEDLVLVLDGRSENLFVYRMSQQNGIQLFQKLALPQVFVDAKARR
jgi:hypothetical protein